MQRHHCHLCGHYPAQVKITDGTKFVTWGCDNCYPGHRAVRLGRLMLVPAVLLSGIAVAFSSWPLGIIAAMFWVVGLAADIKVQR